MEIWRIFLETWVCGLASLCNDNVSLMITSVDADLSPAGGGGGAAVLQSLLHGGQT